MHLCVSTDAGVFRGMADQIRTYDGRKIMVLFFNAELSEQEVILNKLKEITLVAKEHLYNFRPPVQILLRDYRLEYILVADDSISQAFQKALLEKMKAAVIPDRYELPFDIWHLVEIGEYFIKIPGAI